MTSTKPASSAIRKLKLIFPVIDRYRQCCRLRCQGNLDKRGRTIGFQALGIADSTFSHTFPPTWVVRAAAPHDASGHPLPERAHVYPEHAAAGLWTTQTDLATVALAVQSAASGEPGSILSGAMAQRMLEPGLGSFGLSFALSADRSRDAFGHNGANAALRSWFWVHLDGPGLVVMTNGDNGQAIAEQLYWAGERAGLWSA